LAEVRLITWNTTQWVRSASSSSINPYIDA
jgi:hypothetical protein